MLDEILYDLREKGQLLQGDGEQQLVWNCVALDFETPEAQQGVQPKDVLRVSTVAVNG